MNRCPKCDQSTLDFDNYFGRYRCFNAACGWMAPSTTEREMVILNKNQKPEPFFNEAVPDLGIEVTAAYDEINDALLFDFGLNEPTYDLPEPDGRVIWKIGHMSEMVAGVVISGAKNFGVSDVKINIKLRKEEIENILKQTRYPFSAGRPTRVLIDKVELKIKVQNSFQTTFNFMEDAFKSFESKFV